MSRCQVDKVRYEEVEVSKCGKVKISKVSKLSTQERSQKRRVFCTAASSSHATWELIGVLLVKGGKDGIHLDLASEARARQSCMQ